MAFHQRQDMTLFHMKHQKITACSTKPDHSHNIPLLVVRKVLLHYKQAEEDEYREHHKNIYCTKRTKSKNKFALLNKCAITKITCTLYHTARLFWKIEYANKSTNLNICTFTWPIQEKAIKEVAYNVKGIHCPTSNVSEQNIQLKQFNYAISGDQRS